MKVWTESALIIVSMFSYFTTEHPVTTYVSAVWPSEKQPPRNHIPRSTTQERRVLRYLIYGD